LRDEGFFVLYVEDQVVRASICFCCLIWVSNCSSFGGNSFDGRKKKERRRKKKKKKKEALL
jgi:hypothetical protein